MLSKARPRQYDVPGATLRGPYKVWIPPKSLDSDADRDRPRPHDRPPPPSAPAPVPVPALRPAPAPARPSYSTTTATSATTTTTTTSSSSATATAQAQRPWLVPGHAAPGQQPSLSSLSSVGSQKYSTPPTSVSSSFQVKNPRLDAVDVPVRPSSSWRSSADRSIDDRDDKRPSTGESSSSHASSRSATQPDLLSSARAESTHWFNDRQRPHGSLTAAHAARATGSTEIFIPSEVRHARKGSFDKQQQQQQQQQRKEDPGKTAAGYLSDVTERDERTPKMQSRSPPPAPLVFPMYPPDRGAKPSALSAAIPARGISPSNVPTRGYSPSNLPPRGISPSNASRFDPRSRTNSQNDHAGARSPYGWAHQASYAVQQASINTALPAEDEVVVQKLQRAKSTSGTPYPGMQPYAQAGKAEPAPIPIPSRRTTLPGSIPSRDSHSSSHSSLQFAAPSVHGSNSAMNNINGSKTSLTATFSPPPHVSRVSSSSTIAQTTSMLPPQAVMHIRSRSPSQTALPASTITSPVSTRPPTAQAVTYARVHASYMPASTSLLSPSAQAPRNLPPATPHRTSFSSLHPNQTTYPHANAQVVHGATQPSRAVAQTPYNGASVLPPAAASQFASAMQNTSHLPTGRPTAMAQVPSRVQSPLQRIHTPPQRVQTPPRRTQSPAVVLAEQQDSPSDEALSTPASLAATPTASRSQSRAQVAPPAAPETKKRASGGIFNIFRPKRYEFWVPSTDQEAARKKDAEQRHRAEKESAKEQAKLTKAAKESHSSSRRDTSAAQQKESSSHRDAGSNSSNRTMISTSSSHRRQDSSSSIRREHARDPVLMATSRPSGFVLPPPSSHFIPTSAPVAIPNSGRKSPVPRMPFKLFQKKRTRTVSSASLEVLDGNTTANTVVNSPASSIRSPTPGASPPLRDPGAATLEWRDKEEHELVTSGRSRRRRPGVTFDISFEDSPMAGERPKPSRHRSSTPRSAANPLPQDESDEDDEDDDSDDDE